MDELGVRQLFARLLFDYGIFDENGNLVPIDYKQNYAKAQLVGDALKDALRIASESGYIVAENTAEMLLRPLLNRDFAICSDIARYAQNKYNELMGLGIKAIAPQSYNKIDDIVDTAKDIYKKGGDLAGGINGKIDSLNRSTVADCQKKNIDFLGRSNVRIEVKRIAGKCDLNHTTISKKGKAYHYGDKYAKVCDFCSRMEGTYTYPNIPDDVWGFHDGCTCHIEYNNYTKGTRMTR